MFGLDAGLLGTLAGGRRLSRRRRPEPINIHQLATSEASLWSAYGVSGGESSSLSGGTGRRGEGGLGRQSSESVLSLARSRALSLTASSFLSVAARTSSAPSSSSSSSSASSSSSPVLPGSSARQERASSAASARLRLSVATRSSVRFRAARCQSHSSSSYRFTSFLISSLFN